MVLITTALYLRVYDSMKINSKSSQVLTLALSIILAACGGSSSSTPAGTSPETGGTDANMENGDTANGTPNNNQEGNTAGMSPGAMLNVADSPDNADMYLNSNNSARLSGPVVGTGVIDNVVFPKALTLETVVGSSVISVEGAYAVREQRELDENRANIILVVRNNSNVVQCGSITAIQTTLDNGSNFGNDSNISFYDATFNGSLQLNTNGYRRDCIPPGTMAFAEGAIPPSTRDGIPVDQVAGIDGSRSGSFAVPSSDPLEESIIVPVSYSVTADNQIEVLIENRSSIAVTEFKMDLFVLDGDGFPAGYGSSFTEDDLILGPGESGTLTVANDFVNGSFSTIRVIVRADPAQ